MASAKKTFKRIHDPKTIKKRLKPINPLKPTEGEGFGNPLNVLSEGSEDIGELFTPEIPIPEEQTIIPIPDERTAGLDARKRRARARTSGRSSTILTEGLGG